MQCGPHLKYTNQKDRKDQPIEMSSEAIIVAAGGGDLDAVKTLLEEGADVDVVDDEERSPLLSAARNGHLQLVQLLLEKGADLDKGDGEGDTPLTAAAAAGHVDVVKFLLERGRHDEGARERRHGLPVRGTKWSSGGGQVLVGERE